MRAIEQGGRLRRGGGGGQGRRSGKRRTLPLLLGLCLLWLPVSCSDDPAPPFPCSNASEPPPIRDGSGRTLVLHGANFMAVQYDGSPQDYRRMREWGFNAVRILMTWDALEPEQGVYDPDYLPGKVEPQVAYAHEAGLLVILDMHHFHWSTCCDGMGMPEWICRDLPEGGLEWILQSGFLWDHPEYLDAFVGAWETVARFFAGDSRIFAYDLFNEPMAGLRTLPGDCENQLFRPLYVRLIEAIRAIHPEPYLIFEPSIVHGGGFPFVMDPLPHERLIYSPHLYPGNTANGGGYNFPRQLIRGQVERWAEEARQQGTPMLLGEVGLRSDAERAEAYARDSTELMEQAGAHWTWWAFGYDDDSMGLCDSAGGPKELFYRYLSRPYPTVTAGVLRGYRFDPDTRVFEATFANQCGMLPSIEIFLNADYHYPGGFVVRSTDRPGAWGHSYDNGSETLAVSSDPTSLEHTVIVEPRS